MPEKSVQFKELVVGFGMEYIGILQAASAPVLFRSLKDPKPI